MRFLHIIKNIVVPPKSAQTDTGRGETAAMVYMGDVYAVLLHDRVVRQLARAENRRLDHRREAGWPFIR